MQCLGTERRTPDGPELRDRPPVRVTVRFSPASTRSMTSPPWLRNSRIETVPTAVMYHP